jgi:uncharacterized protein YbjT (DUF2867 family)
MAPTILVIGATGNTGRPTTETLSQILSGSNPDSLSGYRILALTRSTRSPVAQQLAALPGVEVLEKNWVDITADWLRAQHVERAFIAPHNQPSAFADESTFHLAALRAGVKYVVRISTTAANVRPDCAAYYARQHWAVEALLGSPEFAALQWTSLQPNVFTGFYLMNAAGLIKEFRETGKQGTLKLMADKDAPVAVVDPYDVGVFAGRILAQENPSEHNRRKYVLNGPEDITGEQVVKLVEQYIGTHVEKVEYRDMSFLDQAAAAATEAKHLTLSIRHAPETAWEGKCSVSTTSKEVLEIAPPSRAPVDGLKELLGE